MERTIAAWSEDDLGDWVAHLSCLHRQHVRRASPFRDRPWVTDAEGRAAQVGAGLDCPLCDRAERPIPPEVLHAVAPAPSTALEVDFLRRREAR